MPDPGASNPQLIQALGDVGSTINQQIESIDRLTSNVSEQTRIDGELTRDRVEALDRKVHVLSLVLKVQAVTVVLLCCFLIWSQWFGRQQVLRTIEESTTVTRQIEECLNPTSVCYQRALAQSECNREGGYCEPGMIPYRPRHDTTTTP